MKTHILCILLSLSSMAFMPQLSAHCQVPCGIYADDNVFVMMQKDQETIAKAMEQITTLSKNPSENANQLNRWITNKEKHAQSIQTTVSEYFLAQRIKFDESDQKAYVNKLILLHKITVSAMKCKQTTDPENAKQLLQLITDFQTAYLKK